MYIYLSLSLSIYIYIYVYMYMNDMGPVGQPLQPQGLLLAYCK